MKSELFSINRYLSPRDHYHFARKTLPAERPHIAHFHDFYETLLIAKGRAEHGINGTIEMLDAGALLFIRPSDTHWLRAADVRGCEIVNVMFRPETADHLISRYRDDLNDLFFWTPGKLPARYQLHGPRFERAVNTAAELVNANRSLSRIEEYLLALMTRVVDLPPHSSTSPPAWLVRACMQARSPDILQGGPKAFVKAAGRGHEHVCRRTKHFLGLTPSQLINKLRMEQAALLLAGSAQPIEQIAAHCGIENLSHFYRTFHKHYGITPKNYRTGHAKPAII